MAAFKELFGATLVTKSGVQPTETLLAGKSSVGIYFSGHWCPPCRGFTPKLAEMYSNAFKAKGMEIVFVSSDKDQSAFDDYYAEMPWTALPYDQRDLKATLSSKWKVQGIPALIILNADGTVITKDGRDAVSSDPTGAKYPWVPPTAAEKAKMVLDNLGADLVAKAAGKPIGLYFSAHWCPPCRSFTPQLAEWYSAGLKDKMEIIFISSDKDAESFGDYFKDMPWLALPFDKRAEKEALSNALGVQGIPSFAVINSDGTIVTLDGRSKVTNDPKAANFPEGWLPQPLNDVNDDPGPLNEEKCLIALGDFAATNAAVKTVAIQHYEKAGKDIESMSFRFFTGPDGGVTSQIRKLTATEGNKLILLDIPDDGSFYVCEGEATSAKVVEKFINDFKDNKLEKKTLQK